MNKVFNKKIFQQINKENIQPKSRWQFVIREILLWLGTTLSLLLASMSAGSFIFQSANFMLVPPGTKILFGAIRIAVIILFIIFAVYQVQRIGRGYKRKRQVYTITGLVIIGIIGSLFFASRISGRIEQEIGPQGLIQQAERHWSDPKTIGLLAGELSEITNDGYLLIESLDGGIHVIDSQHIHIDEQKIFVEFLRVKMVGYEEGNIFYPCSVAPWEVRLGGKEKHSEYKGIRDGNMKFSKEENHINSFQDYFERKDDIVRTNQCRQIINKIYE